MLVLSRKRNEMIRIGDDIVLTVVDVRGDKVRLGINAPREIPVHRLEVYEAIQEERQGNSAPSAEPSAANSSVNAQQRGGRGAQSSPSSG